MFGDNIGTVERARWEAWRCRPCFVLLAQIRSRFAQCNDVRGWLEVAVRRLLAPADAAIASGFPK
jgi:hypothetical protein